MNSNREEERGIRRDTYLPSAGSLLKQLQHPRLGQAKARSQEELHHDSHMGGRDARTRVIFCCFSKHINRSWLRNRTVLGPEMAFQ